MALRVALRGYKVAMWSLEMQATQIAARLFAAMDYLNVSPGPWHGGVMTFRQITTRNMPQAVRERYEASKPQAQALLMRSGSSRLQTSRLSNRQHDAGVLPSESGLQAVRH